MRNGAAWAGGTTQDKAAQRIIIRIIRIIMIIIPVVRVIVSGDAAAVRASACSAEDCSLAGQEMQKQMQAGVSAARGSRGRGVGLGAGVTVVRLGYLVPASARGRRPRSLVFWQRWAGVRWVRVET